MNRNFIFANILCTDTLDMDNLSLQLFAQEQMKKIDGRKYSNRGGWQSNFVDDLPQMQPLVNEINNRLEQLRNVVNFIDEVVLKIESMWININHRYSYNSLHIHPNSYISGVYYVKTPENSGELVLRNPSNIQSMFTPSSVIKSFNEFNSSKWTISPEVGKLVLFPSWIEHEVTQNLSNEDRISIAFNTNFYNRD
jgi:uncharacterized protein (TIGR02466 family)